jgi:hypothetical protein
VVAEAVVEGLLVGVEDFVDAQLVDGLGEGREWEEEAGEQDCQAKA